MRQNHPPPDFADLWYPCFNDVILFIGTFSADMISAAISDLDARSRQPVLMSSGRKSSADRNSSGTTKDSANDDFKLDSKSELEF